MKIGDLLVGKSSVQYLSGIFIAYIWGWQLMGSTRLVALPQPHFTGWCDIRAMKFKLTTKMNKGVVQLKLSRGGKSSFKLVNEIVLTYPIKATSKDAIRSSLAFYLQVSL